MATNNKPVSHRFVDLRRYTARCTCGATYASEASEREEATAELRAQHAAHKANPKPVRKPRARKATK